MHDQLRVTHHRIPDEIQLELLAPWYTQNTGESRTLDFFDAIPKYPFPVTTTISKAERIHVPFTLHGRRYVAEILPAQIKDGETGQERLVFPGGREELVERALRFIAVRQIAKTKLTPDAQSGRQAVTIFFSLSMLRRHLEQLGHGYKLSEIREALDILADTRIAVEEGTIETNTGRQRRTRDYAAILTHYAASTIEGDHNGEETYIAMTFHPAATAAILQLAFYPINQLRVGKLKRPLARWLTTRMSHNYRQARKNFVNAEGYNIALATILIERGMTEERRLRDNVATVRRALAEMKHLRILASVQPFTEKLVYVPTKRRPRSLGPSGRFTRRANSSRRSSRAIRRWQRPDRVSGETGAKVHFCAGFHEHLAQREKRRLAESLRKASPGEIGALFAPSSVTSV